MGTMERARKLWAINGSVKILFEFYTYICTSTIILETKPILVLLHNTRTLLQGYGALSHTLHFQQNFTYLNQREKNIANGKCIFTSSSEVSGRKCQKNCVLLVCNNVAHFFLSLFDALHIIFVVLSLCCVRLLPRFYSNLIIYSFA